MPEPLKASEVESKTDPTVAKHSDHDTPLHDQIDDFYKVVDKQQVCMLTTERASIGPVSRSMAVAKRSGPDFLFIANAHSQKFEDLKSSPTAQIIFQNNSNQDWVSITGKATNTSNNDSRIKELYNPSIKAWFGDLGDGVHNGTPDDPRMALIEVKAEYIVYWKSTVGTLGFIKEVGLAVAKGEVAMNGVTRRFEGSEIEQMRKTA